MSKIWEKYINKKFNMLTVISKDIEKGKDYYWCECECGNIKSIRIDNLKNNNTKSCGCITYKRKLNTYDLTGEFGIGYDSKGRCFYFDLEDYDKIKNYTWLLNNNNYVISIVNKVNIWMHRLVTNCPDNMEVDHIFHNNYDNRKSKLRICTRKENNMNKNIKGVSYNKKYNLWIARIMIDKKQISLGYYKTELEAIEARKDGELKYFGDFAYKEKE